MQVQVYLAQQRPHQALEVLERFSQHFHRPGDIQQMINFLALQLVALHQLGQSEQARVVVTRLLTLTEPESHLRVYLDLGEPMKQALKALLLAPSDESSAAASVSFSRSYVLRLLAAFELKASGTLPLPARMRLRVSSLLEFQEQEAQRLSAQELKVLRLLAAELTYAQMAEDLVVSLNTIKTQVSSIYRKLGVSGRTQAIMVARQLRWL
jgi:LuxR family maltose regulon positive regulatory protein